MSASSSALRKEERGDCKIAGAQGFHQADFAAALEDRSGHGRRNRQRGGKQGGQRDQQHQSLDAREHRAFILRDLADLLGVRVRNRFLQLIGNRLHVGRAVPAVVNFRRSWSWDRGGPARLPAWSAR